MNVTSAAIVANPKVSGGAARRTESITAVLEHLGARVEVIQPSINRRRPPSPTELRLLAQGRIVPEALAWNVADVAHDLALLGPEVIVLQTARAVHPGLFDRLNQTGRHSQPASTGTAPTVVLDLVDQLSTSYRQRADQSNAATAKALRLLAASHERFEKNLRRWEWPALAAGYREAVALDVTWIPNVVKGFDDTPPARWAERPFDVVFFGTLSYQPNVEALDQLDRWVREVNWSGSVLVAGRHPTAEVTQLCRSNGWTVVADFASTQWLADQARLAIAPLRSTAGIQNKVLEAGQVGLAQVVTTAAIAGMDPGIPLSGADDAVSFFERIDRLLGEPDEADAQVRDMRHYLRTNLVAEAVAPRMQEILDHRGRQPSLNEGSL